MAGPFSNTNPLFRPFLDAPEAAPAGLASTIAMPSAAPALPAAIAPVVSKAPSLSDTARANYADVANKPDTISGIHNPLLRGIARAGDIAASVFVPRVAQFIPGTTLNHEYQVGIAANRAKTAEAQDQAEAQLGQTEAQTEAQKAAADYTRQRPAIEQSKIDQKQTTAQQKIIQQAAAHGQIATFDADGIPSFQDDPTSSIYQSRKVADEARQAGEELTAAKTDVEKAKNDPNSPAYKLAVNRLAVAQQNAGAAAMRAQAYYGNYLQGAYNTGLNGQVLPGAPQISTEDGGITPVGSKNASQAVKAQANVAQFKDVHGALDHLESAADELVKSGGSLHSASVATALAMPHSTTTQWLQGLDKANLTPQERNYVQSVISAHENVQALRKSAGGTATDTSVARLEAMMPNASTPDIDYLKGQLKQVRDTATRLGVGVTTVKGGLQNPNQAPKSGEGMQRFTVNGKTYNIPANQVDEFKKDFPNAK